MAITSKLYLKLKLNNIKTNRNKKLFFNKFKLGILWKDFKSLQIYFGVLFQKDFVLKFYK